MSTSQMSTLHAKLLVPCAGCHCFTAGTKLRKPSRINGKPPSEQVLTPNFSRVGLSTAFWGSGPQLLIVEPFLSQHTDTLCEHISNETDL